MLMPGRAWNVALTLTSYGKVYAPDALYRVWKGGTRLQKRKLFGFDGVAFAAVVAGPSQLFVAVRSVVTPPKTNPLPRRAFTLTSTPLYTREFLSDQVPMLFTRPCLAGFRLYMVIGWPAPPVRFGRFGMTIVNGVSSVSGLTSVWRGTCR